MKKVQTNASISVMIGSIWNSFFSLDQFWFWLLVSGWCLCLVPLLSSGARRLYISDPFGGANCARLSGSVGSSHLNLQQRFGLIEGPVCAEPYSGLSLSQKTQFPWGGAACKAVKKTAEWRLVWTNIPLLESHDFPTLLLGSSHDSWMNKCGGEVLLEESA